jgi:hypothetical protein
MYRPFTAFRRTLPFWLITGVVIEALLLGWGPTPVSIAEITSDELPLTSPLQAPENIPEPSPENTAPAEADAPVSRLAFSEQMIKRFAIPMQWMLTGISPFADIPLQDPRYPTLETAWKYKLLQPDENTYAIHPEAPATQLELWRALKQLLFAHEKLRDPYNRALLMEEETVQELDTPDQNTIVILYEHYVMDIITDFPLTPHAPITQPWLDRVLENVDKARVLLASDAQRGISETTLRQIPALPSGLSLRVSPQEAIVGADLKQGMAVYFELRQPLYPQETDMIVESSVLTGYVESIVPLQSPQKNVADVTIAFDTIRNGHSNNVWKLNSRITFPISLERTQRINVIGSDSVFVNNYVLPSEEFTTTTGTSPEPTSP